MKRHALAAAALLTAPLMASGLGVADAAPSPDTVTEAADASSARACSQGIFTDQVSARRIAKRDPEAFAEAARITGISTQDLRRASETDGSLRLNECGAAFYLDEAIQSRSERGRAMRAPAAQQTVPLSQTFELDSKPGASKTVYLDFLGETVSGTDWNSGYNGGATINAAPWSADGAADTNFSDAELVHIQTIWNVMAEDYAPFDVNITTREPDASALERTDASDNSYGLRVIFTNNGPVFSACGCGGAAFLNTFDLTGATRTRYANAWVFGNGTQNNGKYMGDAASHEVGHTLGLVHDGHRSAGAYYGGADPWGPIMGAPYTQPVTQWSKGEYSGADQTQDDLAIISALLPYRGDDHGNTSATATPAEPGSYVRGVIETATDVDTFSFTGSGAYVVDVDNAAASNLDVQLTVTDSAGTVLATVNPTVSWAGPDYAPGLDANVVLDLGPTPATFYATLDGVGSGTPTEAGKFSDYGSLGAYQFNARPAGADEPLPLTATKTQDLSGAVGSTFTGSAPVQVSGGRMPYEYTATGLPAGLELDSATGAITGSPTDAGTFPLTFFVADANDQQIAVRATMSVASSVTGGAVTDHKTVTVQRTKMLNLRLKVLGSFVTKIWSSNDLPNWASLTEAGVLKGLPPTTGSFTIPVSVTGTNRAGVATSDSALITVSVIEPRVKFGFGAVRVVAGTVGQPYTLKFGIRGGYPAYSFQTGGYVPFGTTATQTDPYTLTISGTPNTAGTFGFGVIATDGTGVQAVKNVKVTIRPPA